MAWLSGFLAGISCGIVLTFVLAWIAVKLDERCEKKKGGRV